MIEYKVKVYDNGDKHWYLNGERHREDGPAIEYSDGSASWYLNGNLHREDGPAIEYPDGSTFWCAYGKYHRVDGPAIERVDGRKEWHLNGKEYTEEEFLEATHPAKEYSIAELEAILGHRVKVVK